MDYPTFCCWSFFGCLLIVFGGATPIFADLKDSKRFLMVLWKISCTSFSSLLTSKWLRLYLCRCYKPENKHRKRINSWGLMFKDKNNSLYIHKVYFLYVSESDLNVMNVMHIEDHAHLFPALVQMLLQQVVSVNILSFPHTFHILLVHFQAHRWHRVSPAGDKIMSVSSCLILASMAKKKKIWQEMALDGTLQDHLN